MAGIIAFDLAGRQPEDELRWLLIGIEEDR
jgi:hypothetical protein